jgi:hypothetical protein
MATESSEPRIKLILQLAGVALVTLFAVHGFLNAYYDRMAKAEELRKLGGAPAEALTSLRTDEKARLTSGAMPIDQAMKALTEKGRMAVSPAIAPAISKDLAPLQGWSKLPGEVPEQMTAAPPPPVEPAVAVGDAGAAGDAGGPGAKGDGGAAAPKGKPAKGK